jgi:hypothetical protein
MKTYAVAFTNLFDNITKITFHEAKSPEDAAYNFLRAQDFDANYPPRLETLEDYKELCFSADQLLEVVEVP